MKKYLKIIIFVCVLLLAGCNKKKTSETPTSTPTTIASSPTLNPSSTPTSIPTTDAKEEEISVHFEGMQDVKIEKDANFNVLSNVRVLTNQGLTVSVSIKVESSIELTNNVIPADYIGKVIVEYEAEYNDKTITGSRTITVVESLEESVGTNMITNSTCDTTADWALSNHEGAGSTITSASGELKIAITSLNATNSSSPRINNSTLFTLEKGKTYIVSFDAYADTARKLYVQVGTLIDASPWFIDAKPDSKEIFNLSTTKDTYSFIFTYNLDNTEASVLFEMGIISGEGIITNIYLDNISVAEYLDVVKDTATPNIIASDKVFYLGINDNSFNLLDNVSAYDTIDKDVSSTLSYETFNSEFEEADVDYTKTGKYYVIYSAYDKSGNAIDKIIELTIKEPNKANDNLFYNPGFDENITGWSIAQHDGGYASYEFIDGKLKLIMEDVNWNNDSSSPRLSNIYGFELIKDAYYHVSFTASSEEDKLVLVQIGNLFGESPYWIDLKTDSRETFLITKTETTYEFYFKMNAETTSSGFMTIEMGTVDGDDTVTTLYFDDFLIERIEDEISDYVKPSITNAHDLYYFVNELESLNVLEGVKVIDNVDGDITDKLTYKIFKDDVETTLSDVNLTTTGNYKIVYTVSDTYGNKSIISVSLSFINRPSSSMISTSVWDKLVSEEVDDFEINTDSNIVVTLNDNRGINTWDNRMTSKSFSLSEGGVYRLIFDLESEEEIDFLLQIGRYVDTSNFMVQYTTNISNGKTKTRYVIDFTATATRSDYSLGFEFGGESGENKITISNLSLSLLYKSLTKPFALVLNKISVGTIIAWQGGSGASYTKLYVYQNGELVSNDYRITNGGNLDTTLSELPSGTYTIKIQAIGDGVNSMSSELSDAYTFTK